MVFIRVRDAEPIEDALKRFKRGCEREGIVQEAKRRGFHETPSLKRKRKQEDARRKRRKRRY